MDKQRKIILDNLFAGHVAQKSAITESQIFEKQLKYLATSGNRSLSELRLFGDQNFLAIHIDQYAVS